MRSDPGHIEHLAFPWIASSSSPVERRASLDALSLLAMSVLSNRVAFQRSRKHQPSHLRLRAGFVFAKVLLRYLANRRLRQRVADFHGADHFVLSETLLQKRLHLLERQRRRAGLQLDEGLRRLAAIVVRNSDDAHFLDRRVLIDGLFDVARIDVEAAAEQHVLGAVDDIDEAVLVHGADVKRDERHIAFRDLIDNDGRYQVHPLGALTDELAVIQYTGGTTGSPKGAMLTHANLTAACSLYTEVMTRGEQGLRVGEERVLCILPLFHIYSLTVVMLLGFKLGAELVLHPRFDPAAAVKDIVEKKITVYMGVPTMHVAILSVPGLEKMDFSSLRLCGSGGAPLPVAVQERFESVFGCQLNEGWGMTETEPARTFTPREGARRSGSCGLPYPGTEMKFIDVANPEREVKLGERGEICVKGPNVMKAYWKKPEETANAMTADGFFRTGDVGTMDEDGFVYIVDRTKDMLLCGGFNVYPRNIEEAIYQHPSVEEVSVIGIPDDYRGETPKAFVKLKAGAPPLTLEEMKAYLKDRLGKHEMIGAMEIRDALPKTPVGKISKKELREYEARAHVDA